MRSSLAPLALALLVPCLLLGVGAIAALGSAGAAPAGPAGALPGFEPSRAAVADIPPTYLRLYREAAARFRIDWAVLAGVGRVECDHGRDPDPSCTVEGRVNYAGAGGPMQFLAATWAAYGVDGNGDGIRDRWNPADAIFGAAHYLAASGAATNVRGALLAYNRAVWYAEEVEGWAARYRSSAASAGTGGAAGGEAGEGGSEGLARLARATATLVRVIPGAQAQLDPSDGHVALIPAQAPLVVAAMLIAGNELQELPYGPAGHPDPLGAAEEDCSSSVNYVMYRAGIRPLAEIIRENPLAQDYVHWGSPGPGRWVTIYATDVPTPHVFIVIAGLRLDTARAGIDVGPNREQDGPRWRLLGQIPGWAPWSVRHPPGL